MRFIKSNNVVRKQSSFVQLPPSGKWLLLIRAYKGNGEIFHIHHEARRDCSPSPRFECILLHNYQPQHRSSSRAPLSHTQAFHSVFWTMTISDPSQFQKWTNSAKPWRTLLHGLARLLLAFHQISFSRSHDCFTLLFRFEFIQIYSLK